jgi:hypothetical protein
MTPLEYLRVERISKSDLKKLGVRAWDGITWLSVMPRGGMFRAQNKY